MRVAGIEKGDSGDVGKTNVWSLDKILLDVTQHRLVVINVSVQPIGRIFIGKQSKKIKLYLNKKERLNELRGVFGLIL
jgi:hypothetical protein